MSITINHSTDTFTPSVATGLIIGGSAAILLPSGADGARPSPTVGMIRYSTTSNAPECYMGASPGWTTIGSVDFGLVQATLGGPRSPILIEKAIRNAKYAAQSLLT